MTAEDINSNKDSRPLNKNRTNTIDHSYDPSVRESTFIEVKAQFLVNGQTDDQLAFLNENSGRVRVSHFGVCAARQYDKEINYIVLGTVTKIIPINLSYIICHTSYSLDLILYFLQQYRYHRRHCYFGMHEFSWIVYISRS